jgi:hypothetical protein
MKVGSSAAAINFNLLDIPAELAFIYSQLDGKFNRNYISNPILRQHKILIIQQKLIERDSFKHGSIVPLDSKAKLHRLKSKNNDLSPADLNLFSFNKFLQIYIKVNAA